jgi:hypothetical protein
MKRQWFELGAVDLLSKVGTFVGISRTVAAVGHGEARGRGLGFCLPGIKLDSVVDAGIQRSRPHVENAPHY